MKKKRKRKKNYEMVSRNEFFRIKVVVRESKYEERCLRIGFRIRERIGRFGKKENVMI